MHRMPAAARCSGLARLIDTPDRRQTAGNALRETMNQVTFIQETSDIGKTRSGHDHQDICRKPRQ